MTRKALAELLQGGLGILIEPLVAEEAYFGDLLDDRGPFLDGP